MAERGSGMGPFAEQGASPGTTNPNCELCGGSGAGNGGVGADTCIPGLTVVSAASKLSDMLAAKGGGFDPGFDPRFAFYTGSGGGGANGTRGGGRIRLDITRKFTLDGRISASAEDALCESGAPTGGGGGSGGTVMISAQAFFGFGTIDVSGGFIDGLCYGDDAERGRFDRYPGGGGAGRIYLKCRQHGDSGGAQQCTNRFAFVLKGGHSGYGECTSGGAGVLVQTHLGEGSAGTLLLSARGLGSDSHSFARICVQEESLLGPPFV